MSVNKVCSTFSNKLGKNVETRVDTAGECLLLMLLTHLSLVRTMIIHMGKEMKMTARWLSVSF